MYHDIRLHGESFLRKEGGMGQPITATPPPEPRLPEAMLEPRADCHALIESFPEHMLEDLRDLLTLVQRFLTASPLVLLFVL